MIIGASVKRKEDPRLLAGRGCFVDDVRAPGMLHAVIVRSPHAHARITRIDAAAAKAAPAVVSVILADDLPAIGTIPIRLGAKPSLVPFLQPVLARDRVRYVGEPVALVIAADRYAAEDAADLLNVEYSALPVVVAAEGALSDEAPQLHEPAGTNLADRLEARTGDAEGAMAAAPVRVGERFTIQRHSGVPMETRGVAATYDAALGLLTVWGPTKVPHFNRGVLARFLGWSEDRIRFIEPDVGGGFGVRGEFYPEDFLIPWAAVVLGRPVKWIEDRREHLVAANHSRQQVHEVEIGATLDGRITALIDRITVDMGAYLRTHGVSVPELTLAMLPGPYAVPNYHGVVRCVVTNKTPTGTYRSPGRFESNFVRERMMDLLAEATGLDPAEVRRRNFIPPPSMPCVTGTFALGEPIVYDTGAYASTLDAALDAVDYPRRRREQQHAAGHGRAATRRLGIGVACFVEKAGPGPWETARVAVDPDGRVTVYSGGASVGQGIETVLAQICAQELGAAYDDVTVKHGDTATIAAGIGAWGSRVTVVGGSAVLFAAREVKAMIVDRAAARFEAAQGDLMVENSRVWVKGAPGRSLAFREVAADGGFEAAHKYEASKMTYPYGAHVAVVEINVETGVVNIDDYAIAYDVGRAVNPKLVEGQMVGGLAQGIGGALLEELAYADDGQPLSGTFMDYLMPTVVEMPRRLTVRILEETPTPLNPLGVKGAGEGGTAGAGAAIANAVADALRPLGVKITDLPLSPDRISTLIRRTRADGSI
jgi:carbon-monoxide dehydrogenase large subunit